jgi:protein-disulfide isomerase
MNKRSFYQQAPMNYHIVVTIMAALMIGLSLYLTSHYFAVKFPTGLETSGLCNINSFFNCDVATNSAASNIAGVPISIFGVFIGLFIFAGYLIKNEAFEGTTHAILLINAVSCLVLFIYSLVALRGLCPGCTGYYVASWITAAVFFKHSDMKIPAVSALASYGVVFAIAFAVMFNIVQGKEKAINQVADSLIKQYKALENLGAPSFESDFNMISATENFTQAPIQITKFSDFECPACKMLSEIMHEMAKKYKGKINIQYFFYPLDNACNPAMERPLHRYACLAANLASCLPKKFQQFEKDVFDNQSSLSSEWLEAYAKKENVMDCYKSQKAKDTVSKYIAEAKRFGVQSTPTFLLNGVKIEGVLPAAQLSILIDYLLTK